MAAITQYQPYGLPGQIRSFIAKTAAATTAIHILSTALIAPEHATDNAGSVLIQDGLEVQGSQWTGGATNYRKVASDGTITFYGTARIDWIKKTANGATIRNAHGTTGSAVTDLQTAHDGNAYTLVEEAETPGMDVEVDFTSITAFNWVQVMARYEGSSSHGITIQLEITPFDGSAWHTYGYFEDQPADQNYQNLSFFVSSDTAYINSGVVKVRLVHEMAGTPNHELVIDNVALYH